jgi:hypothetical protein
VAVIAANWALIGTLAAIATAAVGVIAWRFPRHPRSTDEADVGVADIRALPGGRFEVTLFNRGKAHAAHVHAFIDRAGAKKTSFDAEHVAEPVLFGAIADGKRSRPEILSLSQLPQEGEKLAVWTAWRDGTRSWLDSPPVRSTVKVPEPLAGDAGSSEDEADREFTYIDEPEPIPNEPFFYDPARDRIEWADVAGSYHKDIIPRLEAATSARRCRMYFPACTPFAQGRSSFMVVAQRQRSQRRQRPSRTCT